MSDLTNLVAEEAISHPPDEGGHFGPYGGRFVPEVLMAALDELTEAFADAQADPAFRAELTAIAASEGRQVLHARLAAAAPTVARRLHPNDHVRVIRALELVRAGSPAGVSQTRWRAPAADPNVVYVGLTADRARLDERLRRRAAAMVEAGLEDEVRRLLARGYSPALPAMQGIGYREFARVVAGDLTREEALRLMQRDTLRYARRQWTWFAREPAQWIDVDAVDGGAAGVAAAIAKTLEQEGGIG